MPVQLFCVLCCCSPAVRCVWTRLNLPSIATAPCTLYQYSTARAVCDASLCIQVLLRAALVSFSARRRFETADASSASSRLALAHRRPTSLRRDRTRPAFLESSGSSYGCVELCCVPNQHRKRGEILSHASNAARAPLLEIASSVDPRGAVAPRARRRHEARS